MKIDGFFHTFSPSPINPVPTMNFFQTLTSCCFCCFAITVFLPLPAEAAGPMPILTAKNIAHRGASGIAPENTLVAMKKGIEAGADGCECDLYASKDGRIVLLHDKNLKRTTGFDGNVSEQSFEKIRSLDAGSWKSPEYKGEKIPTFDEYLGLFAETEARPVIEIKQEGIEADLVAAIRKAKMTEKVIVIAFSEKVVKNVREIEPKICIGWLYSQKFEGTAEENSEEFAKTIIAKAENAGTSVVSLAHDMISPKLLELLRDRGLHVWCWTVDDPKRMEVLLDWGLESITTNYPDRLAEILKKRK